MQVGNGLAGRHGEAVAGDDGQLVAAEDARAGRLQKGQGLSMTGYAA